MAVNINVPSQVKTYANLAAFPASGSLKTIYIAEDTNKTYRWTGSVYVEISASAAMTWGQIGGTLSNQTDLQNALDAKVPTSRTLTINGVTQDLSADRTFTISTGITIGTTAIASGTVGRILFEGAGNVVQESSSLTWDNAANRFQVGTGVNILATNTFPTNANSPYVVLGPYNANFGGDQGALFNLTNNNTTGNSAAIFRFGITSPATGAIGEFGATSSTFSGFTSLVFFNSKGAFPLAFLTNDTERLRIHGTTGNVLIGTTTDAGFRLDVNGTARVQSTLGVNGSVTANTASSGTGYEGYKIQDGANARFVAERLITNFLGIGHNSVSGRWDDVLLGSAQRLYFYTGASERMRIFSTGNVGINTTTDAGFRLDVNGTARVQGQLTTTGRVAINGTTLVANAAMQVNGTNQFVNYNTSFSSGSFYTYQAFGAWEAVGSDAATGTILAFGGYRSSQWTGITFHSNGVERMRIKSTGVLNISSVPTSSAGLSAGDVWNDAGTLKIV